ncbi:MAG: YceK/YidQ family lipoprotein [Verrucomicrobiota bacterium]
MTRTLTGYARRISLLMLACLSLFVSGCSSVITHSIARAASPPPPMYMGGLRMDYLAIAESESWGPQAYGVVDMPFSLVADVILLPYRPLRGPSSHRKPGT